VDVRDLFVTPLVVILIYIVAYFVRPSLCDNVNYKYFFPALSVKIVGAILLGVIYTFYYNGGDTFNFHTIGSRVMWEAFWDSPSDWIDMFFANGQHQGSFYKYSSRIYFFSDKPSFFLIQIASVFDLFTLSSYAGTACFFAVISFAGGWAMFVTFYRRYPQLIKWIAITTLFIPSVVFWGSGLLKDTLVLAFLGFIVYTVDQIFILKKYSLISIILLVVSLYSVFVMRKFILQAFVPSAFLWVYYSRLISFKSPVLRILVFPVIVCLVAGFSYFSFVKIGEGDVRYSVDKLAETSRTTAYDIAYYSGRGAGSTYSLGELDGTFSGMLKLAPAAINVSLYRPYLWEIRSPLMVLSAVESFVFLLFTIYIILLRRQNFLLALKNEDVIFMLVFSIIFAFATGVSSYNFGSLSRYRIALLPFFSTALVLILYSNSLKKEGELESTEN
jgi:hypothetical protein